MLDGRSSLHGGVGWDGDGARWGARGWPVSAWWAGAGGQSSDDKSWNPVEARSSRGVNPTHTEPQPDTAGGKHHKGGNSTRGNPPANSVGVYLFCITMFFWCATLGSVPCAGVLVCSLYINRLCMTDDVPPLFPRSPSTWP